MPVDGADLAPCGVVLQQSASCGERIRMPLSSDFGNISSLHNIKYFSIHSILYTPNMSDKITLYSHAGVRLSVASELPTSGEMLTVNIGTKPMEGGHHHGRAWAAVRQQNDGLREYSLAHSTLQERRP